MESIRRRSVRSPGYGAGIVLEGPSGFLLEYSLVFKFKVSNNQAEYEALVAGLELTKDMGARKLICRMDSQLVVGQMNGEFQVKEDSLLRYFQRGLVLSNKLQENRDSAHTSGTKCTGGYVIQTQLGQREGTSHNRHPTSFVATFGGMLCDNHE